MGRGGQCLGGLFKVGWGRNRTTKNYREKGPRSTALAGKEYLLFNPNYPDDDSTSRSIEELFELTVNERGEARLFYF